jgi:hypothetical protein
MANATQAEIDLEFMQSKYGKNELLHQALDRAVLRGAMRVEAVTDAMDLFGDKCLVDPTHLDVTLNGLPLDAAVEKLIESRPLWRPQGPDPATVARRELEGAALAGNVTAHGQLARIMGKGAYDQWRAKNAAQPGKAAVAVTDDTNTDTDPKNPFVGFRDANGKVDPAKSAIVAARIKSDGIAAVTKLAKEAGVTLGGYPLRKAG